MIEPTLDDRDRARRIRVETRFGGFDVDPQDVLLFPDGLPGFEPCRHFLVLSDDSGGLLYCLHAVDGADASFLAVDPRLVLPSYRCDLSTADRQRLRADEHTSLLWLALVTMVGELEGSVNLRAPIVINPAGMIGYQVMPHNTLYPLRHPLKLG
ncbi:MAG TPA: flagellar assembly protein FliW [Vicinamibacterales bacterium]|nr:flagellar assembly protein FliW [Vicinamibacterales bacterium]